MRKSNINGHEIPYNLSITELNELVSSSNMVSFMLGCEALSQKDDIEAFNILFRCLSKEDKYKRRYALEAISHHAYKERLTEILEKSLSDDILIIKTALCIIYQERIRVSKEKVFNVFRIKGDELDHYHFWSILVVATQNDFDEGLALLKKYKSKESVEHVLVEVLFNITADENWVELYDLIKDHKKPQIRMAACRLFVKYNNLAELTKFIEDQDGHIRKFVQKFL